MNRLCVVVDGLIGLSVTQISKIKRLQKNLDETVFVINSYNPYFERFYFFESDEFKPAREGHFQMLSKIREDISQLFINSENTIEIIEHCEKDLTSFIETLLEEKEYFLLVLATAELTNRHTIHIETIRAINCPVMMLTRRGWPKKVNISAAIDPVHQKDINTTVDIKILEYARSIASHLNNNLRLVHSRFSPPLLQVFSQLIASIHNQSVDHFIETQNVTESNVDRISGNPEITLPTYVSREGIDLLVIGSMSRNSTQRQLVGSTAESLLRDFPCDLLLIK